MKVKKTTLTLAICLILIVLASITVLYNNNIETKPKAKILTNIGCLEVEDSVEEIEARNKVFGEVFNFELVRCE